MLLSRKRISKFGSKKIRIIEQMEQNKNDLGERNYCERQIFNAQKKESVYIEQIQQRILQIFCQTQNFNAHTS